jgi:hypothetical protein
MRDVTSKMPQESAKSPKGGHYMKRTISTFSRCAFLVLLFAILLGPLSSAHATDWGFTLIESPSAERNGDEEFHETIQMTGAGTFNPEQGTASGGGSFTIVNAFDDIGGPTFHGTWKVTEFISWEPDGEPKHGLQGGILRVQIMLFFEAGARPAFKPFTLGGPSQPGLVLTITGDGINVDFFGEETFGTNPTGLAVFHIKKP